MISNRICQSLSKVHVRRSVAPIYLQRQHIHVAVKHNLFRLNLCEPRVAGGRKCRPIFQSSCCSSVRYYNSDSPDSAGVVRLLRGFRQERLDEVEMPSFFGCFMNLYQLTKHFDENLNPFAALYGYLAGFEQGFSRYLDFIRESNPSDLPDLDRDWILPEAQEDTKEILPKLPTKDLPENTRFIFPFFVGYVIQKHDSTKSVDAAFLYACGFLRHDNTTPFFHLVFTRKFGPGVKDGWNIKNVALYMV